MTCNKYENALLRAAASNAELDANLARHLEQCSTCRITLHAERELLAQIDSALRAQVNEDPRPGFLPQLRLELSKELTCRPELNRVWHVAGAVLALVLVATFYPLVKARQPSIEGNQQTPTIRALPSIELTQSARASDDLGVRSSHRSKRPAVQSASPQEPEVLVPPDEQKAFAQFVVCVAGRDATAEAVVSPAADKPVAEHTELPRVVSVDMAALEFNGAEQSEWMAKTGESD
jgi:hypothetical protein